MELILLIVLMVIKVQKLLQLCHTYNDINAFHVQYACSFVHISKLHSWKHTFYFSSLIFKTDLIMKWIDPIKPMLPIPVRLVASLVYQRLQFGCWQNKKQNCILPSETQLCALSDFHYKQNESSRIGVPMLISIFHTFLFSNKHSNK